MTLESLGWNNFFEEHFVSYKQDGLIPARISIQHKKSYLVHSEMGEINGIISGKFRFEATSTQDFPVVGDWVAIEFNSINQPAIIHHVLKRKSTISRKVPGDHLNAQILAANIDIAFLVMGLDADYNPRRMERYLTIAWEGEARPVIILNKIDKCEDPHKRAEEIAKIAPRVVILLTNAKKGIGIDRLKDFLKTGVTGVLLGSSGVGKSTITNHLLGPDHEKIRAIHETDDRGRHLTTHRELLILPCGGLIIDTPGLRELQLWGGDFGMQETFEDIYELAKECKFRDCKHESEPNCAVKKAVEAGTLDRKRYESYIKLQREISYQERKLAIGAQRLEKERWKKISKQAKDTRRNRDKEI